MREIPEIIKNLEQRLNQLVSKDNKPTVSIDDVAELLEVDREKLMAAAVMGTLPFGFGCPSPAKQGNRYARISKLTLWRWMMNCK